MIDIDAMIQKEIENGYGDANAQSKVCQDLVLKAISTSYKDKSYTSRLRTKDANWLGVDSEVVTKGLIDFLKQLQFTNYTQKQIYCGCIVRKWDGIRLTTQIGNNLFLTENFDRKKYSKFRAYNTR